MLSVLVAALCVIGLVCLVLRFFFLRFYLFENESEHKQGERQREREKQSLH